MHYYFAFFCDTAENSFFSLACSPKFDFIKKFSLQTLSKSIIDLEISGYVIGQQFPKEQSIKEGKHCQKCYLIYFNKSLTTFLARPYSG